MTKKKLTDVEKALQLIEKLGTIGPKIPLILNKEPFSTFNIKEKLAPFIEEVIQISDSLKQSGVVGIYNLIANVISIIENHSEFQIQYGNNASPTNLIYQVFLKATILLDDLHVKHQKIDKKLFTSKGNSAAPYIIYDAIGSYYFLRELKECLGSEEFSELNKYFTDDLKKYRDLLEFIKTNNLKKWMKIDTENKTVSIKTEGNSYFKIPTNLFEPIIMEYEQLRNEYLNISKDIFDTNEIITGIELQILFLDRLSEDPDFGYYLNAIYTSVNAVFKNENRTIKHLHKLFSLMGVEIMKNGILSPLTSHEDFLKNYSEPESRYRQIQEREVMKAISKRK